MALLTKAAEDKIIGLLISEGLADSAVVDDIKNRPELLDKPILAELVKRKIVTDDMVSHATAVLIGVPYVELKNIAIDQDILSLIPRDAQLRTVSIPLGEKDGMLNIAMADVTNVQYTDYLSNLVNKPIRVWMSSERGIREMIEKNHGDFSGVTEAVRETASEAVEDESQ